MSGRATVRRLHGPLDAAVAAVARRVLDDLDRLVPKMGEAYQQAVPEYASLSGVQLATEVLPVSRKIVEVFFTRLLEGREPDAAEVHELEQMGRKRLEMGIHLEPMLHVYRVAGRVVWDAVVAATRPGEERALAELGARWMDYIDRSASIAAASYLAASHERLRTVDARRRALLDALLSAADAAELAAVSVRFSTVMAAAYVPVLLDGDRVSAGIDVVLAAAPEGTIGGSRGGRVLLLVPAPLADAGPLWQAGGGGLLAHGTGAAPGPALLAEVGHTEALIAAAVARGHNTGVFGPDDLLLEQLLAGNDRVAAALRARVPDRLSGRDHDALVVSTLRSYLACGSIPATARREVVHPNTVLYRLKRVRDLTGLDPRVPTDAALLVLALRAAEVRR